VFRFSDTQRHYGAVVLLRTVVFYMDPCSYAYYYSNFPRSKSSQARKFPTTDVPGNESSPEQSSGNESKKDYDVTSDALTFWCQLLQLNLPEVSTYEF